MTHTTQHTCFHGPYRRRLNFTGSARVTCAATMGDRFLITGRSSSKAVTSINRTADAGGTKTEDINTIVVEKK
jgi:hypothetical protein